MTTGADSSMRRGAVILETLIDAGVRQVVLAPGSRSAPIALAVAAAERAGRIRLHVRIDERSAGYLAVGIAKGSGAPVAVITTSGTAAVNLHPAIVEASYGGVPLIAVTADRPERLRGVGANQTIVQHDIFGGECRFSVDLTTADVEEDAAAVVEAITAATDAHHPGPAHLNIALDEPLVDTRNRDSDAGVPKAEVPDAGVPDAGVPDSGVHMGEVIGESHGVILVGDTAGFPASIADPERLQDLARATGWPIISEPSGNASALAGALRHGPLIVSDAAFLAEYTPQVVVTIGRVGLHRSTMAMVARSQSHIVIDPRPSGYACDPLRTADRTLSTLPIVDVVADPEWMGGWRAADDRWRQHLDGVWGSGGDGVFDGVAVARTVAAAITDADTLVVGPSWPARHMSAYAGPIAGRVLANRGTSGIDGMVSTAWGVASTSAGFTVALLGDLTAIYDRNGLLAAPGEEHPHLAYVVVDNDGGGIFGELEQGDPAFAADFERVFGTPHGARLSELLGAPGVMVREVADIATLGASLAEARTVPGVHVIIATTVSRADQVASLTDVTDSFVPGA